MHRLIFLLELIGTIAFAASGAMVGIRKKMDIFGVMVMAIVTAVGGGIMRDMILGYLPPAAFLNPVYVEISILTSLILFVVIYNKDRFSENKMSVWYEKAMLLMDAVGLGVFTTLGIEKAYENGYREDTFLLLFVGILTGVGGGVIRDVFAMEMPYIFMKHIYACASLLGAIFCVAVMPYAKEVAMVGGTVIVILIRILAAKYRWNLPQMR